MSSAVRPSSYVLSLTSIDRKNDNILHYTATENTAITAETVIVLEATLKLPIKCLWNINVLAYACKENVVTTGIKLSKIKILSYIACTHINCQCFINVGTHEVQQIQVLSRLGSITVSGRFIDGSTTMGVLTIIYSIINESDIHYSVISHQTSKKMFSVSFQGVSNGPHNISFFTVEKNGHPFR